MTNARPRCTFRWPLQRLRDNLTKRDRQLQATLSSAHIFNSGHTPHTHIRAERENTKRAPSTYTCGLQQSCRHFWLCKTTASAHQKYHELVTMVRMFAYNVDRMRSNATALGPSWKPLTPRAPTKPRGNSSPHAHQLNHASRQTATAVSHYIINRVIGELVHAVASGSSLHPVKQRTSNIKNNTRRGAGAAGT